MSFPRILFGTPQGGRLHPNMVQCLEHVTAELSDRRIPFETRLEPRGGIALAHSLLARDFLASKADKLFIVHGDVSGFSFADVERIASSERDVIGAPIPGRSFEVERIRRASIAGVQPEDLWMHASPMLWWPLPPPFEHTDGHLVEVMAMAPAFLCISRHAMVEACKLASHVWWEDLELDYVFEETVYEANGRPQLASEDVSFCLRWRSSGGRVWCDTKTHLIHWGEAAFRAAPLDDVLTSLGPVRESMLGKGTRVIPFRTKVDLVCPESCEACTREIAGNLYDLPLRFDENPPRILDVGGNIGAYARWALARWPGSRVWVYEPASGDVAAALAANTIAGAMHVRPLAVVSDARKSVALYERPHNPVSTSLTGAPGEVPRIVPAIDALELPDCEIVKLDLEGDEPAIWARYMERTRPTRGVAIEWHEGTRARDALRGLMDKFGFRIVKELPTQHEDIGVMLAVRD